MSEEQYRTQKRENDTKTSNGWKWAFIGLVAVILVFMFYVWSLFMPVVNQPVNEEGTNNIVPSREEHITLSTTIDCEDAEWLMNTYLAESINENEANYRVELSDQLELYGQLEFLSFDVPFSLHFDPYVLENGNIQLRAKGVEVGRFSLPVRTVMTLFANQANIPDFIGVNTEEAFIYIYLDQLFADYAFDLRLQRIDLEENDIQVDLFLREEAIIENIDFLEESHF